MLNWNDEKRIELDLHKIIKWWFEKFSPPLMNRGYIRKAEIELSLFLENKFENMKFDIKITVDKNGEPSVEYSYKPDFKID